MKYKIGQKVVYIGRDLRNHPHVVGHVTVPVPGQIYTIRGGRLATDILGRDEGVGYVLEEIVNPVRRWVTGEMLEMHINERFLRPLQERKNDGEAFVAGLRPLLNVRFGRGTVPLVKPWEPVR